MKAITTTQIKYITLYLFLSLFVFDVKGQVEIDRESFDLVDGVNLTCTECRGSITSATCGNNDIFNVTSDARLTTCTGGPISGNSGSIFLADDLDALSPIVPSGSSVIARLNVPAGNNGVIILSVNLAAWSTANNGTSVDLDVSIDGASYVNKATFTPASGTTYTDGTNTITSAFTTLTYDLGSGHAGKTIDVKVSFSDFLSGSEGFALDEFVLYHACSAPTTQASNLVISNNPCNSMELNWVRGNGSDVLVVARLDGVAVGNPSTGTTYTANSVFGSGDETSAANGNFVVYSGTGTNVTVTNLTANSSYVFTLYEFNGTCYNVTELSGTRTLDCTAPTVSVFEPADGSTDVCPSSLLKMTFDENITSGSSGSFDVYNSSDNTIFESIPYNDSRVSISGNTLTLNLSLNFVAGANYYVQISNTAVTDMFGNAFAGILDNTTWDFTTINFLTYYVNDNSLTGDEFCSAIGSAVGTGTATDPFLTLSSALNVAGSCDIIYVDAGTYQSTSDRELNLTTPNVTIIGAGSEKTIFDREGSERYFMYVSGNNVVLQDFTAQNFDERTCGGPKTGQVFGVASNTTGVVFNNVVARSSDAVGIGCGLPIMINSGASVTFNGGQSSCNVNPQGGGGIEVDNATVNFNSYIFYGNFSQVDDQGALVVRAGNVNLNNCRFSSNSVSKSGSAIVILGGTVSIDQSLFDFNISTNSSQPVVGGAISMRAGTLTVDRSEFMGNGKNSYVDGGAIGVTGGNATITRSLFSGNFGALAKDIYCDNATVVIDNCTFTSGSEQVNRSEDVNNVPNPNSVITITNSGSPSGNVVSDGVSPTFSTRPDLSSLGVSGTCNSTIVVLPIDLKSFNGACKDLANQLLWKTASEKRNDFFTIERAGIDGKFVKIGEVKGAGSISTEKIYNFEDTHPLIGANFYRLSQTDLNGEKNILKTINVVNHCSENTSKTSTAYFEKQNNEVLINSPFENMKDYSLKLYNSMGQEIAKKQFFSGVGSTSTTIQLEHHLAEAAYFVVIESNTHKETVKVVVN